MYDIASLGTVRENKQYREKYIHYIFIHYSYSTNEQSHKEWERMGNTRRNCNVIKQLITFSSTFDYMKNDKEILSKSSFHHSIYYHQCHANNTFGKLYEKLLSTD